jgi:hypothetical protein
MQSRCARLEVSLTGASTMVPSCILAHHLHTLILNQADGVRSTLSLSEVRALCDGLPALRHLHCTFELDKLIAEDVRIMSAADVESNARLSATSRMMLFGDSAFDGSTRSAAEAVYRAALEGEEFAEELVRLHMMELMPSVGKCERPPYSSLVSLSLIIEPRRGAFEREYQSITVGLTRFLTSFPHLQSLAIYMMRCGVLRVPGSALSSMHREFDPSTSVCTAVCDFLALHTSLTSLSLAAIGANQYIVDDIISACASSQARVASLSMDGFSVSRWMREDLAECLASSSRAMTELDISRNHDRQSSSFFPGEYIDDLHLEESRTLRRLRLDYIAPWPGRELGGPPRTLMAAVAECVSLTSVDVYVKGKSL